MGSHWKQACISSDNRLPALGRDRSTYLFAAPEDGETVTVTAELRFRRLFQVEQAARGWAMSDVVMEGAEVALPVPPSNRTYLPLAARAR